MENKTEHKWPEGTRNTRPGVYECEDCPKDFVITQADLDRCAEKGWAPPIRCSSCRHIRRSGMIVAT